MFCGHARTELQRIPEILPEALELRRSQSSPDQTPFHFVGPVLVRTMPTYYVLALPGLCGLYIVDSLDSAISAFLKEFRARSGPDSHPEQVWLIGHANLSPDATLKALQTANNDPLPAVRDIAARLQKAVHAEPLQTVPQPAPQTSTPGS